MAAARPWPRVLLRRLLPAGEEPAHRERLVDQRRRSYRSCYDEACQIELGKVLAAQKSLSTRLLRVGERCAITAVLYDLRTETTETAASVDTSCSVEPLLGAMRSVALQLAKPR